MPTDAVLGSELRGTLTLIDQTIRDISREFRADEDANPYLLRTSSGEFPLIHLLQARSNVLLALTEINGRKRTSFVNRT